MKKYCERCGEKFLTDKLHPYARFCGGTCRSKIKHERKYVPKIIKCKICGGKFNPRGPQITCSKSCQKINKNRNSMRWNKENWEGFYFK